MDHKEKNIKRAIIDTTNAIKRKYKALHQNRIDNEIVFKEHFAPITTPLTELVKEVKENHKKEKKELYSPIKKEKEDENNSSNESDFEENAQLRHTSYNYEDEDSTSDYYETPVTKKKQKLNFSNDDLEQSPSVNNRSDNKIQEYLSSVLDKTSDDVYGIRNERGIFKMGNETVEVLPNGLKIKETFFAYSKGLFDLIFKKKPKVGYTTKDLAEYRKMLEITNSYRKNYSANGAIKGNAGYKYMNIIKPIVQNKRGGTLGGTIEPKYMQVLNKNIDYKYWDNPNELVDRLRLLLSSKSAGHTGHENEIMSIIEELREANIIE